MLKKVYIPILNVSKKYFNSAVTVYAGDTMIVAFVLLTTVPGKEESIAETLKKEDIVQECHLVYGEYDIHLTIHTEDLQALDEFVHEIRLLKGIGHTMTLIALQ